jgi:hypothetical protein
METLKELAEEFDGRGEVRGHHFRQVKKYQNGYIYEVSINGDVTHYEVFKRVVNTQFNNISYPTSNAFGRTAWTTITLAHAIEKYEEEQNAGN